MNLHTAMALAVEKAREFAGATSPNPPVGAVALDDRGEVLEALAHRKAGEAHAEARVLSSLRERGKLHSIETLVVTLEPCNHQGRTGPCTEAILAAGVKHVVYAVSDPNPKVAGHGAELLRQRGLRVEKLETESARRLIAPFARWVCHQRPWVVLKQAFDSQGSMIPPPGQKTFTSERSLILAHQLRKESDAIITGSGTILADDPEFSVRKVLDHEGKRRWLVVLDRRARVPESWMESARARGLEPVRAGTPKEALDFLGSKGALQALVEAGPLVSDAFLGGCLWDQRVVIEKGVAGQDDTVREFLRES